MDDKEYGRLGELLAINYLKKNGYKILVANYSSKVGEVDIIALETKKVRKKQATYKSLPKEMKREDKLVFVEVKSRRTAGAVRPSDAVGNKKKMHYSSVASSFRLYNPKFANLPYRFDIIEVVGEEVVSHLIDAF